MALVDPKTGVLTDIGLNRINELWRQVAAGFVIVPVTIDQTASANNLIFSPVLHQEGQASLATGMAFWGMNTKTSTGNVTANLGLATGIQVYKVDGTVAAGAGDIVINHRNVYIYDAALNSGAGGFVQK